MNTESPLQRDEEGRIKALQNYNLDDLVEKQEFEALTRLAARICDMPMALINFIESERMWSLAGYGTELQDMPRKESACRYTILQDDFHEIKDLRKHPDFKNNPAVVSGPQLRYYGGVPLKTGGYNIGSLCMYDDEVNKLKPRQVDSLKILADEIVARLDLRLSQKELEKFNKQKDEVLHIVSHDMRNPLSGIIGISSLVRTQGVKNEEGLKTNMRLIEESARHLLRNVNELLDVSYIESGAMQLNPSLIDLEKATRDTIELHNAAARVKNIEIKSELNIKLSKGRYDEIRYEQILGNLITNAVKFTPAGGKVTVRASYPVQTEDKNRQAVKLEVADTGVGIPEKYMDKLFTKYGEHGRKGTAGEKSLGLGLPLLKKLVDTHDGTIEVESEVEKGTRFTVWLPEAEAGSGNRMNTK